MALLVLIILSLTIVGLAVPNFTIQVQHVGAGSTPITSPACTGGIQFHSSDNVNVDYVLVHFENNLSEGTEVYVLVKNSSGTIIAMGNTTLTSDLPAGQDIQIHITFPIQDAASVEVILNSPSQNMPLGEKPIYMYPNKIGYGEVQPSRHYPIVITENSGNDLYNYSVKIIAYGDPGNSLYFLDSSGKPLYYWYYYDPNTNQDIIFVKIPYIPANGHVVIFLHYGGTNPYLNYFNGDKTFLFFDDFNGTSLSTSKWNVQGTVNVQNGELVLSPGSWVWTKKSFPDNIAIDFRANINGNPGFLWYIDNSTGWGYIDDINWYVYQNRGHLWKFNVNNGSWIDQNQEGSTTYTLGNYTYFEITAPGGSAQTTVKVYQFTDWTLPSEKNSFTVDVLQNGLIGMEQYTYPSSSSYYDWILVRRYVYPEPSISTPGSYYDINFTPCYTGTGS